MSLRAGRSPHSSRWSRCFPSGIGRSVIQKLCTKKLTKNETIVEVTRIERSPHDLGKVLEGSLVQRGGEAPESFGEDFGSEDSAVRAGSVLDRKSVV